MQDEIDKDKGIYKEPALQPTDLQITKMMDLLVLCWLDFYVFSALFPVALHAEKWRRIVAKVTFKVFLYRLSILLS